MPTVTMAFLSMIVFYLPAESNEKITLAISILLALVVFLLLVSKVRIFSREDKLLKLLDFAPYFVKYSPNGKVSSPNFYHEYDNDYGKWDWTIIGRLIVSDIRSNNQRVFSWSRNSYDAQLDADRIFKGTSWKLRRKMKLTSVPADFVGYEAVRVDRNGNKQEETWKTRKTKHENCIAGGVEEADGENRRIRKTGEG